MRVLYTTTIGATMRFFSPFLRKFISDGHTVDFACNPVGSPVPAYYDEWGCRSFPLSWERSPTKIGNLEAIKQLKRLVSENHYDIVHCHTPIAAACTRLACRKVRKEGTKVLYTAHGFHFYKGAPLINWLIYYPIEWICAHWTDVLITINTEDYARAQKHMHAKRVEYVPGVGIDIAKFSAPISEGEKGELRRSIGLEEGDKLLLSVGELNQNKNHEVVIRALAELNDPTVHYAVAGEGVRLDYLSELAQTLGVGGRVHLLGQRSDVAALHQTADLYIHPSYREGISVALMEAIASRTPVICSNIRGNNDLVGDSALFACDDVSGLAEKIKAFLCDPHDNEISKNYDNLKKYEVGAVVDRMNEIYAQVHRGELNG